MEPDRRGLSGSAIKLIAIVTMLIDHTAGVILARLILESRLENSAGMAGVYAMDERLYMAYAIMRNIGRIAFPIFCFLLVEGFEHTHDKKKYALRLGLFALISEIPFDLAFSSKIFGTEYQNIFFTLLLGLLAMLGYRMLEERAEWNGTLRLLLQLAVIFAAMGAAELLRTDYGAKGVMCIMILYMFRKNKKLQVIAGCISFVWWEAWALLAFIPIALYNGKRGWNIKYLFYAFYPVHLLILYFLCCIMGISGISVV